MSGILDTIKADLGSAGDWLEAEAEAGAEALWGLLKQSFIALTSGQAQIVVGMLSEFSKDRAAGMSLEEIETALLTLAGAKELELIEGIASSDIQALIALWKSKEGIAND